MSKCSVDFWLNKMNKYNEGRLLRGYVAFFKGNTKGFAESVGISRKKLYNLYEMQIIPGADKEKILTINETQFHHEAQILYRILFEEYLPATGNRKKNSDNVNSVVQNKSSENITQSGSNQRLNVKPEKESDLIERIRKKQGRINELETQNKSLVKSVNRLTGILANLQEKMLTLMNKYDKD